MLDLHRVSRSNQRRRQVERVNPHRGKFDFSIATPVSGARGGPVAFCVRSGPPNGGPRCPNGGPRCPNGGPRWRPSPRGGLHESRLKIEYLKN